MTAEHRGRVIEVVITSRTRNAVVRKGTWVRIPHSPPSKNPVTMRVSGFFFFCARSKNHPIFSCSFQHFGKNSFWLYSCFLLHFAPVCCQNCLLWEVAFCSPSSASRTVSNCNPDWHKYSLRWKNPSAPSNPESAWAVHRWPAIMKQIPLSIKIDNS